MTNAPAPMIGGINCPPVLAADSTPAAKRAGKPARFISGIVITPVDTVLAIDDPEMVPVRPDDTTATNPGPPTTLPATALAIAITKSPAPELNRKAPNRMNIKTNDTEICEMLPNSASSP